MKINKKFLSIFFIAFLAIALIGCDGVETVFTTEDTEETTTGETTTGETTTGETTTGETTTEETTTEETTLPVDLETLIDQLKVQYADTLEDETFLATDDLNLISSIGGIDITWSSNNTDYLENDGTVHRPSYSVGNQTVVLKATISDGTDEESYSFFVTIQALDKTDQERADEVFEVVTAFPDKEKWSVADSGSLDFLTEGKDADDVTYTVTWTSSHPDIISTDGTIIQTDQEVDVTMTATIEIGGVDYTKDVVFTVAEAPELDAEVDNIADAIALGEDAYVKITGVTVIQMYDSGDVFFTDGVDILYIYSPPFDAVVGEVYDISGIVDLYYNAYQFSGDDDQPLIAAPSTEAVSEAPVTVVEDIFGIVNDNDLPSEDNKFIYKKYTVTASVYYDDSWGNYSVFLVPTDYNFEADLATGATQPNGTSIMVYYRSDMDVLKAFHGQSVTIDVILQGFRTDKGVWYVNFFGTEDDVDFFFATDQDAIDAAYNGLSFPKYAIEDDTLDLPSSILGVDLTYTSTNDAIIDPATGAIDTTGVTYEVVTISVEASYGETTETRTYDIPVGIPATSDISDALDSDNGYLFNVEGTVIAGGYYNTFFIEDETGNIALYVYDDTAIALLEANVGNVVQVVGERDAYGGLNQLRLKTVEYVADGTLPTAINIDGFNLDSESLLDYQGNLVELTDMVIIDVYEDDYGNIEVTLERLTDGETIELRWDSRYDLPTELDTLINGLEVGDKVDVTTVLAWYYGPQLYFTTTIDITVSDLTDQEKIDLDIQDIPETLVLEEDLDIPTAEFGSTYTVMEIFGNASNYIDFTTTEGKLIVTQPYGVDATATMTIKVESGTVSEEITIDIIVKAIPITAETEDLFFSEYGEGSSQNKWLEIYNGTGEDINLSDYTIELYSNGATVTTNILELTGILADGDVYVITTTDAIQAIQDHADQAYPYPDVVYFNGDDAVVLKKDGEIIDTILDIGHPADDKVAAEVTWVRNPDILKGNTVFDATEWTEYGQNYTDDLGVHEMDTVELTDEIKLGYDKAELDLGGYVYAEEEIVLPTTGTYGSTITWAITEDAGSNADLTAGVLTLSAVADDAVVVIEATLSLGDTTPITTTATYTYKLVGTSDVQRVTNDKADLEALDLDAELYLAEEIELPTVGAYGSDIAWTITSDVDSMATLNAEGDMVSIANALEAETTVELTATISYGTESDTVIVTYTLKAYPIVDLGDFEDQTMEDIVVVQGYVYAVIGNGFFIEDETGKLFVLEYDAEYEVGDEVFLTGEVDEYNGSYQLSNVMEMPEALSTGNDVEQTPIIYEDGVTELVPGQTYSVFGTVAIEGYYSNVFIYVNETDAFEIYYQSPSDSIAALEAMEGKEILVDIIYYNDGDTFVFTGEATGVQEVITVTDFTEFYTMTDGTNYDLPDDTIVLISGVVTGNSYDGLFIQDTNGVGFFMFRPEGDGDRVIGEEVTYLGVLDTYNGARQLGYGAYLLEAGTTGNTLIVTSVTADEIDAFDTPDAGTLYSFDGFTYEGLDGNHMILGYTLADGVTTGTVMVRYYSNWDDLSTIAENYTVGDAIPELEFILYNFRDDTNQLDVVTADFTDADYIQFDANSVPETMELVEDLEIVTGDYGSTFTITDITGDAAAYLDYTTTPGMLLVTQPAVGDADATGVVTVEVSLGTETPITVTIDVTVLAEVDLSGETTYTETFTDLGYTGGSYAAGSFVGDNGITWNYTESRGDFTLDGQAIMLDKDGDGSSLSATITGGISSFSVDFYDAYSGAAQVELWINGTLVATSISFDDDGDGSVYSTFEVTGINVEGEFTIEILAAGSQMVLDNLTWTTYTVNNDMVETFTNFDLTGTSYAAGSFVGDNGNTWNYTESRGDFTLDGQAIMLDKDGDGSSLSATITGGISSFSVDFYDAYSGAAQIELWINGTLVATSVSFNDGDATNYETFIVENIDVAGEFTIEILAADSQMVLDNLTWTPYTAE